MIYQCYFMKQICCLFFNTCSYAEEVLGLNLKGSPPRNNSNIRSIIVVATIKPIFQKRFKTFLKYLASFFFKLSTYLTMVNSKFFEFFTKEAIPLTKIMLVSNTISKFRSTILFGIYMWYIENQYGFPRTCFYLRNSSSGANILLTEVTSFMVMKKLLIISEHNRLVKSEGNEYPTRPISRCYPLY